MALTQVEKERMADARLKIQAVTESLEHVDPRKVPGFDKIRDCLEESDHSLEGALPGSKAASDPTKV